MKHGNAFYIQLTRQLFSVKHPNFNNLSHDAKWAYVCLKELEHRFSGSQVNFFYHSDKDVAKFTGFCLRKWKKVKKELKEVVQMWKMHWVDKDGKKSRKYITAYRISE